MGHNIRAIQKGRHKHFVRLKLYPQENPLFLTEYRQDFVNSFLLVDAGYTQGYKKKSNKKSDGGRAHFFSNYIKNFIDDKEKTSSLEVNVEKVSNDTYLKIYDVNSSLVKKDETILENKIDYIYQNKDFYFGLTPGVYEDTTKQGHLRHEYLLPLTLEKNIISGGKYGFLDLGSHLRLRNYETNKQTNFFINNFDWKSNAEKFPMLTTPDPAYHGIVFADACGPAAFITRARVVPLRNMGGAISPMSSFQILQGIESLAVRMDRHCSNAEAVAEFLDKHDSVTWVNYPGLKSHPDNSLIEKYMGGKASSVMSFGIKGGAEAGGKFIDKLKLIVRLVNIGDAKSLACHPASTTHRQLNKEELEAAGVPEDMVRLSIGIEHIEDILEDLTQALK